MIGFIEVTRNNVACSKAQNKLLLSVNAISRITPTMSDTMAIIDCDSAQCSYNVIQSYDELKRLIEEATAHLSDTAIPLPTEGGNRG